MRFDPKARFAGIPLGRVRKALKRLYGYDWTMDDLRDLLEIDEETFGRVAEKLQADGLIEVTHQWPHGTTVWHMTARGGQLALASGRKRVPRALAKAHLEGLLERVREVNASKHFLYRVSRVRLFGSLLRADRPFVSDADVAIDLEPKEQDAGRHAALMEKRGSEAAAQGRRFSGTLERRWWGLGEVWPFLRGDSKLLHLVPEEDGVLEQTETRVVFEDAGGTPPS